MSLYRLFQGFDVAENTYGSGDESDWKLSSSRWKRGKGLGLNRTPTTLTLTPRDHATGNTTQTFSEAYYRLYIRVDKYPESGKRCWFLKADQRCALTLEANGKVSFDNYAGLGYTTLDTTTATLALGTWTRVELHVKCNSLAASAPNPPYENNALVEVRFDGTDVLTIDRSGVQPSYGIDVYNAVMGQLQYGQFYTPGMTGVLAFYHLDDLAMEAGTEATWVGPSHSARIVPSGPGTYTGFDVSTTWLSLGRGSAGNIPSLYPISTAGTDKMSVEFEPTSPVGQGFLASTPVRSAKAMVWGRHDIGEDIKIGIRHNGTDYWCDRTVNTTGRLLGFVLDSLSGATCGDTWEVIVDANGITDLEIYHVQLSLEVVGDEPSLGTDIETKTGYYNGNGTQQVIDVGFMTDLLFIGILNVPYGETPTGSNIPIVSMLAQTADYTQLNGTGGIGDFIAARPNGFGVWGNSSNDYNGSGKCYYWLAIKDPSWRVWDLGEWPNSGTSTVDDVTISTRDTTGIPELVMASLPGSAGSGSLRHYSLIFTGDQCYRWSGGTANPVSDYIQSQSAGAFQIGTGLSSVGTHVRYLATKSRTLYSSALLHDCVAWVGDGTGERSIPADLGGRTPVFSFVIGDQASYGNSARFSAWPASYSCRVSAASLDTLSIVGEGPNELVVGERHNANGVQYFAMVFAEGVDVDTYIAGVAGLLDIEVDAAAPWWPGHIISQRTYPVQCEQRYFPVEPEDRTVQVGCDQRRFTVEPYCDRTKE